MNTASPAPAQCVCSDALRRLEAEVRELRRALLAGGPDQTMTLREAHESRRFPYRPRSVERWLREPDLRKRWRLDLLLERIGGRYFTTPARIEAWRLALIERDKKNESRDVTRGSGGTPAWTK